MGQTSAPRWKQTRNSPTRRSRSQRASNQASDRVKVPYRLYGGVLECTQSNTREAIVVGPAETGKTLGVLAYINWLAYAYPGAQISIIRKVRSDLQPSVMRTFHRDFIEAGYCPQVKVVGGKWPQWYDYPGGSRVWLAGLDDPGKTLSSERDLIYVNQCEQLSLTDWEYLTRCVTGRGAVIPNPRLIGDCNPAHRSHWILQRAAVGSIKLFQSYHKDNPTLWDAGRNKWTIQGMRTLDMLGHLTGERRMRLFQGLWANPEGAIFDTFSEERHVVRSFSIPAIWPKVCGVDPVGAQVAAVWGAFDPGGKVLHIYREYRQPFGVTTSSHAKAMLEASYHENIFGWWGGAPSERQQRADFSAAGVPLIQPPIGDLWSGIDHINDLLTTGALVIHDSCPNLISELGAYARVLDKQGNATEEIVDKETFHMTDSLRYLVAGIGGGQVSEIVYRPVRVGPW